MKTLTAIATLAFGSVASFGILSLEHKATAIPAASAPSTCAGSITIHANGATSGEELACME